MQSELAKFHECLIGSMLALTKDEELEDCYKKINEMRGLKQI